jgi:hypothetical protein
MGFFEKKETAMVKRREKGNRKNNINGIELS